MARVMLRLYTTLKDRVGTGKVWAEGNHVGEVLAQFLAGHGGLVKDVLLDEQGRVQPYFVLALNSQMLVRADMGGWVEVPVQDGDLLHIFPPIAGG